MVVGTSVVSLVVFAVVCCVVSARVVEDCLVVVGTSVVSLSVSAPGIVDSSLFSVGFPFVKLFDVVCSFSAFEVFIGASFLFVDVVASVVKSFVGS